MKYSFYGIVPLASILLIVVLAPFSQSAQSSGLECFVADEPSVDGPAAPTDLTDSLSTALPLFQIDLSWTDQSEDEACFVIEARVAFPGVFDVIAILQANATTFRDEGPYGEGDTIEYRLYAASTSARSDYSNVTLADIPIFEPLPTPTPPPSASPVHQPSPSPVATSGSPHPPAPSATASTKLTPAAFPATGGSPFPGGSSLGAALGAFAFLAAASLAEALAARPGRR